MGTQSVVESRFYTPILSTSITLPHLALGPVELVDAVTCDLACTVSFGQHIQGITICATPLPSPALVSPDKSSVSRPTVLEKLLTVDCLFGFVAVSAQEKGWVKKEQGSWRTLVFSSFSLF